MTTTDDKTSAQKIRALYTGQLSTPHSDLTLWTCIEQAADIAAAGEAALRAENEALRAMVAEERANVLAEEEAKVNVANIAAGELIALRADRDRLAADLGVAREALAFYADPTLDGYDVMVTNYGLSTEGGVIIQDGGDKARAALARMGATHPPPASS